MNEHDIFNEIVKLHMPKEIDGWDIHVRMLDDDYKQYNGRKILEMKAICREFPRVHTIRIVIPYDFSLPDYIGKFEREEDKIWVYEEYVKYITETLYSMLHKIMDAIISGGELDE